MKPQSSSATRSGTKKNAIPAASVEQKQATEQPQLSIGRQNLKEFKMEIDHEIAKCLDTLDRQGLKYLRETLRTSKLFDDEIKQVLEQQAKQNEKIQKQKKSSNAKQTIQKKQVKQVKPAKPTVTATDKGKDLKGKNISKQKKVISKQKNKNTEKAQQIQQQILEQYDAFLNDTDQPSKQKTKLGPNSTQPLKQQKTMPLKLEKFQQSNQDLKPFAKRTASRQGTRSGIEDPKMPNKSQQIVQKSQKQLQNHIQIKQLTKVNNEVGQIVKKITSLPQQKLRRLQKYLTALQNSQRIQQQQLANIAKYANLNQTKPYLLKPDPLQNQSLNIISSQNPSTMKSTTHGGAGNSKNKEKATSLYNSIMKGNKKVSSPQLEKYVQPGSQQVSQFQEKEDNQNKGNGNQGQIGQEISEIEVEQQAHQPKTMNIHSQMINQKQQMKSEVKQIAGYASVTNKIQQQKNDDPSMGKRTLSDLKKNSLVKNFPISNVKKPLDIQVTESHQADTLELNQGMSNSKMVRLGKKKLGTNKVKIVLLRNRGHASIIGLTAIYMYNTAYKQITITSDNIKSVTPKLLKLFNTSSSTTNQEQMFTTVFKRDFQIELEVSQKIGGIKIWNYNKSEIQNSKETDWIQVYINDRMVWEGLIKKGSYNQIQDYATLAMIQEGFDFSKVKKQGGSQTKIEQVSQGPSSSENIRPEGPSGVYIKPKDKQKQSKANWLQNTQMEDKIIKMIEQDRKMEQKAQKRPSEKALNRFSQLYQQQNPSSKQIISKPKQQFYASIGSNRQENSSKQILNKIDNFRSTNKVSVQRVTRTNSQKQYEEQKDIFSSFGQSLIKQKIKTNQINAKVNQISQKVEKLKEGYSKKDIENTGFESLIMTKQQPVVAQTKVVKQVPKIQPKQKKNYEKQSLDDFMNDSLFQDAPSKPDKKSQPTPTYTQKQSSILKQAQQKTKIDIDDFLNQLNDLVGSKQNRYQFGNQKQKSVTIPELPKGNKIQIVILSNWGDQQFIGINKIQFFQSSGQRVFPSQMKWSGGAAGAIIGVFSNSMGYTTDQASQWKSQRKQQIKIDLTFSKKIELSLIRMWNFVGDRVHAMIGVRKIQFILDGSLIFTGDVRKNAGNSRDEVYKSCQNILFTNNVIIQKRISDNDWLAQQLQFERQQHILFKKTSQNFMRPLTNGLSNKQIKINENKQGIKLPKRNCFEYDPPNLPSGYFVKIILHTTWGDRDFIGLNGLVAFDEKGNQITDIKKISQFPAPLITLPGYQKDKRILNNLFDGKNLTSNDESIWLAPYLRDLDKMQKQAQNAILIQFDRICTLSAINVYNYVKTPQRGVREIEIHVDNFLVYRGYIKMANWETGQVLTTINFTKDTNVLEKVGYIGYNQDNLGQEVYFYNEGKIQKPMF